MPQDYVGTVSVSTTSKTGPTGPSANTGTTVNDSFTTYTPATVVDPMLFGGEPSYNADPHDAKAATSFVSWPVSSRVHIGVLYRSTDGALSYVRRQADLTDPAEGGPGCAGRPRPFCFSGGGGDTDVFLTTGASGGRLVYMADQEFLANQAVGASLDNGTTFPADHVDPLVAKTTGVDRQWLGAWAGTDDVFLAYHVPLLGEFVNHSPSAGATGTWDIPLTAQIPGVSQSGGMYVDNAAGSPFHRAIYIAYLADGLNSAPDGGSAFDPSATPLSGFVVAVSTDGAKTFVNHKVPGGDSARNFVKVSGDAAGNLYATWTDSNTQKTYLSTSLATAPENVGAPATRWSKPVVVSNTPVRVSIFPDVVAGSPGRAAVIYYGTGANAATPDDVQKGGGGWLPYVAVTTDALCQWGTSPCSAPTFHQTPVAHKVNHDDNICTSGTTCAATGGNRNLLDFWDVSLDAQGHLGFVWSDTVNGIGQPFVKVARQATGPSLYDGMPAAALPPRANGVADSAGDALLPISGAGRTGATNVPTLDLRSAAVAMKGDQLELRVALASTKDLGGHVPSGVDGTTPLQQVKYLVRWDDTKGSYYAGANVAAGGSPQFFSGTVNTNEGLLVAGGGTTAYGNTYAPQSAATGTIDGDTLVIDVPASAVDAPKVGSPLFSVGAYAIVGPQDALETVNTLPLTVDMTPTFDTRLAAVAASPSASPSATSAGGSGGGSGAGTGSAAAGGGSLAATGGSAALTVVGALLIAAGLVSSRRRGRHVP